MLVSSREPCNEIALKSAQLSNNPSQYLYKALCFSIQAYFNVNALALIRALVTGGATQELEQIIAEGAGICGGATVEALENRKRCKVHMFSLNSAPLAKFGVHYFFLKLIQKLLQNTLMLLLILYEKH